MADYQVWLYDNFGQRVAMIERPVSLSYARKVNSVGTLTFTVPRDDHPDELFHEDARIEVWRKPDNGQWQREMECVWLLQGETRGESASDGRYRRIKALSANCLLERRIVNAAPGTAGALKTGPAHDVMKEYVSEAWAGGGAGSWTWSGGTASRDWSSTILVEADSGGSTITKDASYKNLLQVCQEICRDASWQSYTFFDLVPISVGSFEFRTYAGQRGQNRTGPFGTGAAGQVVITPERGTLGGTVELTTDYEDSASLILAGGSGQGANRVVEPFGDLTRIGASLWGLREVFVSATTATTTGAVLAEATAALRQRLPQRTFQGELISAPGAEYGLDWWWGDIVLAVVEGEQFAVWVDGLSVSVQAGAETIKPTLRVQQV